jgi:hypothetical protein
MSRIKDDHMKQLVAATLALLLIFPARAHAANSTASWAVFHNRVFNYGVSYPITWLHTKTQGMDLVVHTADKNAGFAAVAVVHQRQTTSLALQTIADSEIYALAGSHKVAIHHATPLLHGVSFTDATAIVATPNGRAGRVEALVAYRAQAEYIFYSYLFTKVHDAPNAAATDEAAALARIRASITITVPLGSVTPP